MIYNFHSQIMTNCFNNASTNTTDSTCQSQIQFCDGLIYFLHCDFNNNTMHDMKTDEEKDVCWFDSSYGERISSKMVENSINFPYLQDISKLFIIEYGNKCVTMVNNNSKTNKSKAIKHRCSKHGGIPLMFDPKVSADLESYLVNNINLGASAQFSIFESNTYNNSYFITSTTTNACLNLIKQVTKAKPKEQLIVCSDGQIQVSPVSFLLHLNNSQSKNGDQNVSNISDISNTSKRFQISPIVVGADGAIQFKDYLNITQAITIGSLNDSGNIRARSFIESSIELVGCKHSKFKVFTPCNRMRLGMLQFCALCLFKSL